MVGYNGIDGKEVTISKLKEDINQIRDSRSILMKKNSKWYPKSVIFVWENKMKIKVIKRKKYLRKMEE